MKAPQLASLVLLALPPCACDGDEKAQADVVDAAPKTPAEAEPETEPEDEPAAEEPKTGADGSAQDDARAGGDGNAEDESKVSVDEASTLVGPDGRPLKVKIGGRVPPPQ